ncbi:sporulation histidine kinase inhibitor Sda [Filobacillus milosensis]|uniref:Sporulation histidine kinase inhibitor Sda n=1 Tax=Filobacillus milosensis TaxID=94137 RepID=A0A4Y8IRN5_9BACI|nr:sporulation histidine kinase inhibitor Sda [Filobacillus milosensis]TFB24387.1 sporulation histidine kinase inhibitor Sda [Filobacillus milosensis]
MYALSDHELIKLYSNAKTLNLENHFILLIEQEIKLRGLQPPNEQKVSLKQDSFNS